MATIIMNSNKKGVTFRIQVTLRHGITRKTQMTTWRPPPGLTPKQMRAMAESVANEFEETVKKQALNNIEIQHNIKVSEFSVLFLAYLKKQAKPSHYATMEEAFTYVLPRLGNFKVVDLTPRIIQDFVDYMRDLTYTKTIIQATNLNAEKDRQHYTIMTLASRVGCSPTTIKKALAGGNIDLRIAENIASLLKKKVDYLFKITTTTHPYSYSRKEKALKAVSGMLSYAKRNLIVKENFATLEYVTGFDKDNHEKNYLQDYHVLDLLKKLNDEPDIRKKVVAYIAIIMGYRRGEIAGLEWDDIDLGTGKICIKRAHITVKGRGSLDSTPKSTAGQRTSYMPTQLLDLVKEYKAWWDDNVEKLGDKYKGSKRLFLQQDGKKTVNPSTLAVWLKSLEKKYNLPIVSMHSLRATSITMHKNSNLMTDAELIKEAGHSNIAVTNKHYIMPFTSEQKKTALIKEQIFNIESDEPTLS